jgi:hypothetical protein
MRVAWELFARAAVNGAAASDLAEQGYSYCR